MNRCSLKRCGVAVKEIIQYISKDKGNYMSPKRLKKSFPGTISKILPGGFAS